MKMEFKLPTKVKALAILTRIDPAKDMVVVDITTNKAWIIEGRNGYGPECWDVRVEHTVACLDPKNMYQMLIRDEDTGFFYEVTNVKETQKILNAKLLGKEIMGDIKDNRFSLATPESLKDTELENDIYAAIIGETERLEHEKIYRGNGHHLAQRLTAMIMEKINPEKVS